VSDDITQLLLDVQKLSQLKAILSQMYDAYNTMYKGYEDVKGISQGTFSLHKAFLDALLQVSPAVGSYYKVAGIISKEAALVKEYQSAKSYFQGTGRFTSAELGRIGDKYNQLLQGSLQNLEELTMILTAGQLRMSDAERLSAIDRIDAGMTDNLARLHGFDDQLAMQAAVRTRQMQEGQAGMGMYGLTP
jgi:hypothetical protein